MCGEQISVIALPLTTVLALHALASSLGVLFVCLFTAFLGLPLLMGVLIGRTGLRRWAMVANLGCGGSLRPASLPGGICSSCIFALAPSMRRTVPWPTSPTSARFSLSDAFVCLRVFLSDSKLGGLVLTELSSDHDGGGALVTEFTDLMVDVF
jgi:hypothetical protein